MHQSLKPAYQLSKRVSEIAPGILCASRYAVIFVPTTFSQLRTYGLMLLEIGSANGGIQIRAGNGAL
jgi:hypothetical protein